MACLVDKYVLTCNKECLNVLDVNALYLYKNHYYSLLHVAMFKDYLVVFRALIEEYNVDPNKKDEDGSTILHDAVLRDALYVKCLVENGAKINVQNNNGCTPLHILCDEYQRTRNCYNNFAYLRIYGGEPSICNNDGDTPLKYMVGKNEHDMFIRFIPDSSKELSNWWTRITNNIRKGYW